MVLWVVSQNDSTTDSYSNGDKRRYQYRLGGGVKKYEVYAATFTAGKTQEGKHTPCTPPPPPPTTGSAIAALAAYITWILALM